MPFNKLTVNKFEIIPNESIQYMKKLFKLPALYEAFIQQLRYPGIGGYLIYRPEVSFFRNNSIFISLNKKR